MCDGGPASKLLGWRQVEADPVSAKMRAIGLIGGETAEREMAAYLRQYKLLLGHLLRHPGFRQVWP